LRSHPDRREATAQDLQAKLEKLLLEAEDCALISKLSPDPEKRTVFAKLSLNLRSLARELESAIAVRTDANSSKGGVKEAP